ncbi:acyltransferase family protein [Streptomyces antibioticus]|uniref:acyltransferase family protein n=1 Tax=Streptomyces antibioticus TaxID=1890 RepID=UPI0033C1A5A5
MRPELLVAVDWTQWLTLGFQIMPLFFLAGGYAAGGSWERARAVGGTAVGRVGQRAIRLLLPTAVYSGLVLVALGICPGAGVDPGTIALVGWAMVPGAGVDPGTIALAGWAMAMQFWFLPVHLLLNALTPVLYALHRLAGPVVPAVGGVGALGVSWLVAATSGAGAGVVGVVNHLLVWGPSINWGPAGGTGWSGGGRWCRPGWWPGAAWRSP